MNKPESEPEPEADDDNAKPLTLREIVGSIFAAGIGIQSGRNHDRDFRRGSARQYVIVGLLATLLFVALVYGAVKIVIAIAAS